MYRLWIIHTDGRVERTEETRKTRQAAQSLCDYENQKARKHSGTQRYEIRLDPPTFQFYP